METKKCPSCGKTILSISKVCKHCRTSFEPNTPKIKSGAPVPIVTKYADIRKALQYLLQEKSDTAFVTISEDEYFVQFCYDPEAQELIFEAVEANLIENEEEYFQYLAFSYDPDRGDGMYCKCIPLKDCSVNKIVQEIETIFEKIYQTDLHYYEIKTDEDEDEDDGGYDDDDENDELYEEEATDTSPPKKKKVAWWLWALCVLLLFFGPVARIIGIVGLVGAIAYTIYAAYKESR